MTPACSSDAHDALRRDHETFRASTTYVGVLDLNDEYSNDPVLELRNCPACNSTLSIEIAPWVARRLKERDRYARELQEEAR